MERTRTGLELRRQTARARLAARGVLLRLEGRGAATDRSPCLRQNRLGRGVVLNRTDILHEVIAAGAVALPPRRQGLAASQDLLDHDVRPVIWHGWWALRRE